MRDELVGWRLQAACGVLHGGRRGRLLELTSGPAAAGCHHPRTRSDKLCEESRRHKTATPLPTILSIKLNARFRQQ